MNTHLKLKTLLLSTAVGLLVLPCTQAMAQAAGAGNEVEEVVVTAQKRTETSLVVPMGLTAVSGEELEAKQAFRLEDIVGKVPGLNMSETLGAQLVVRGIASTSASINAPVATYIDDTPLVGIGAFSGGYANTPNLDTFDLKRIEVLKGPQGTLYGASALGGLLKYVTNEPDPTGFAGRLQVGASSVAHSDGTGHNLHGMLNVPLGDKVAFRVVGYDNRYPGYIDDPARGARDINDTRVYGGRASLLWMPTDDLSIRLNVLNQQRRWSGMSFVEVSPGVHTPLTCALCQKRDADQPGESDLDFYNLTVNWDLGPVEVTSSTTYDKWRFRQFQDLVGLNTTADALKGAAGSGLWGLLVDFDYQGEDVVHETRISSNNEGRFKWQAGVYYTDKDTSQDQVYLPLSRTTHIADTVEFGGSFQPTTYKEVAVFGNVNFAVTPTFDISVGGRLSDQDQTFEQIGRIVAPSAPLAKMEDRVATYSADARWRFTPESMVYARFATGFVPGGPNVAPFGAVNFPSTYQSSTTTNYEVGYKSALLQKRLTVELSAFQIDWKDIQLTQQFGIYNAIANGGTAVSKGVEWAFNYKPISGLTLGLSGAYTDSHLTENPPPSVAGFEGDRLPVTPRWQTAASAEYRWPIFGVTGFAGADWRYASSRFADLTTTPATRQQLPSYDIVDLRAGIESERWTLGLYAKNVGNTRTLGYVTQETAGTFYRGYINTPRTVGFDLTLNF